MVGFSELLRALFDSPDSDFVPLLMADRLGDDETGQFPRSFYRAREEWIRHCTGSNRREGKNLPAPESNLLTSEFIQFIEHAIAPGVWAHTKWKGAMTRITRKGRTILIRTRVRTVAFAGGSISATIKLEVRRGFVYRMMVCENAYRELIPHILRAFPESAVQLSNQDSSLGIYFPGRGAGFMPRGRWRERDCGVCLRRDSVPDEVFEAFRSIINHRHWSMVTQQPERDTAYMRPEDDQIPHARLALTGAVTRAARERAGIAPRFAGWWNDTASHLILDPFASTPALRK